MPNEYQGKAKRMVPREDGTIEVHFKDDATAFNGKKHAIFPGKGALNSRITEFFFTELGKIGIANQHLGRVDDVTLLATQVEIIPLETVVRYVVTGSLTKRTGLPEGTRCRQPIVEFYYKRDDLGDPLFAEDHIALLQLATPAELRELRERALAAASSVRETATRAGLDLWDLKFEFGRTPKGIILADEISPDTCRFRDAKDGRILDKDVFRQDKGDLIAVYREVLDRLAGDASA